MASPSDLVTVFRSADRNAADEAASVLDLLADAGLNPAMFDDSAPGVPMGAYEVRVPADEETRAMDVIDEAYADAPAPEAGDTSHNMDLVTIYQGMGTAAEVEAMSQRSVLDAYHIPNVVVGSSQYPNLPILLKVPAVLQPQAEAALNEAQSAGPAAAEEAAAEGMASA
ncbi:MAG: hypothetical protein U0Q16_32375 [Bryobacteraceae bacterium]